MDYIKIKLSRSIKTAVLAVGGQSKSAFCFAKGGSAYLSDSEGDLSDLENFKRFEREIKKAQKKLKIRPGIIACDLHPEYTSTKYALRMTNGERRTTKVQHHKAHVASCMADNDIRGNVIGVAFDGTGFGEDGNIWGGEFFVGPLKGLKRAGHLKYIPMPGAEASIKEPWRMAVSYMYSVYGKKYKTLKGLLRSFHSLAMTKDSDMLCQMINKKINSPLTSSMGRLFDGVSALIGVCSFAKYEGEAAVELEKIIWATSHKPQAKSKYKFKYIDENGVIIINWEPVIKGIVKDMGEGMDKSEISMKFHNAVCDMIKDVCKLLKKKYKIKNVCMTGGVFQNKYLAIRVKPMLEKEGFNVYGHKNIPTHDGGIALGQAILAAN